jgi:predicted secreted protein
VHADALSTGIKRHRKPICISDPREFDIFEAPCGNVFYLNGRRYLVAKKFLEKEESERERERETEREREREKVQMNEQSWQTL